MKISTVRRAKQILDIPKDIIEGLTLEEAVTTLNNTKDIMAALPLLLDTNTLDIPEAFMISLSTEDRAT